MRLVACGAAVGTLAAEKRLLAIPAHNVDICIDRCSRLCITHTAAYRATSHAVYTAGGAYTMAHIPN